MPLLNGAKETLIGGDCYRYVAPLALGNPWRPSGQGANIKGQIKEMC